MKRIELTLAIVLGIAVGASAQNRGLFNRGPESDESYDAYGRTNGSPLMLPQEHDTGIDHNAPLGGGALLLIGFGAAYALKKRRED